MNEPWCVLLAGRPVPPRAESALLDRTGDVELPTLRDPLITALTRATTVASQQRTAAVVTSQNGGSRETLSQYLEPRNLFVLPQHQGTGYEVLFALLHLEILLSPSTPVIFLPVDCVVGDEDVMTRTLNTLVDWIIREPRPVYLLGAVPRGPHDQLGYIIPWHDAIHMPTSVYGFVERPDVREARRLIDLGGLWNTFIFGGTLVSLANLFHPDFDSVATALRSSLRRRSENMENVAQILERSTVLDFSQGVLARRTDQLHVLRLPPCEWWPLKSPDLDRQLRAANVEPMTRERSSSVT